MKLETYFMDETELLDDIITDLQSAKDDVDRASDDFAASRRNLLATPSKQTQAAFELARRRYQRALSAYNAAQEQFAEWELSQCEFDTRPY